MLRIPFSTGHIESMKKHKTVSSKKRASRKSSGAFKRLASKALKLVGAKHKPAAKPAKKAKPAAAPLKKVKGKTAALSVAGRQLTESDIRRMPEASYMNDIQLDFFRRRLLQMRAEVVDREVDVKERLHQRESFADPADRATAEEEHWLDLRLRERESLLLRKIDEALRRIRDREFGYCEVTGEPIGIPRLLARPTATVCVDVKGQNEQIESQFRDR